MCRAAIAGFVVSFVAVIVVVAPACSAPSHPKEAARAHDTVWVAFDDGTVSAIDTSDNSVRETVKVGADPRALVARDRFVYVAVGGGADAEGVVVVDAHRKSIARTVKVGADPGGVDVHERDLLAANRGSARATAVDATSGRVHGMIDVGVNPSAVAFSPNGKTAWIAGDNLVTVVDASNNGTIAALDVGARAIAFSADGAKAYLATNNGVQIFDAAAFMPIGDAVFHAVNAVAAIDDGFVAISDRSIDIVTGNGVKRIAIGGLDLAVANGNAYVVDGKDVVVVDLQNGKTIARVHAGKGPRHVTLAR